MASVAAIQERDPAQHIGCISLMMGKHNRGLARIALAAQGSAASRMISEAVEVVTDYWFDELGFQLLRAPKAIADTASRRSLRRLACA
jgi:hypothetical protein